MNTLPEIRKLQEVTTFLLKTLDTKTDDTNFNMDTFFEGYQNHFKVLKRTRCGNKFNLQLVDVGNVNQQVQKLLDVVTYLLEEMNPVDNHRFDRGLMLMNFKRHMEILGEQKPTEDDFKRMENESDDSDHYLPDYCDDDHSEIDLMKTEERVVDADIAGGDVDTAIVENKHKNVEVDMNQIRSQPDDVNHHDNDESKNLVDCSPTVINIKKKQESRDGVASKVRKVYPCPHCKKTFSQNKNLTKHLGLLRCRVLRRLSKTKDNRIKPSKKLSSLIPKGYNCDICMEKFSTWDQNVAHDEEKHMKNGQFKCYCCDFTDSDKTKLMEHLAFHHQLMPYFMCGLCPVLFMELQDLNDHMLEVHNKTPEKGMCPICSQVIEKKNLRSHVDGEHSLAKYSCFICGAKHKSRTSASLHMKNSHGEGARLIPCHICGQSVKSYAFAHHIEKHNATEKNVECPQCGKRYYTLHDMRRHVSEYHRKTKFMCDQCEFHTSYIESFKRHMEVHTQAGAFKCDHCDFKTHNQYNLNNHITIHTGEKKFPCDFCGKAFRLKANLREHRKIHTGEFSGHCDICNKSFVQKCNYKLHMMKSHSIRA